MIWWRPGATNQSSTKAGRVPIDGAQGVAKPTQGVVDDRQLRPALVTGLVEVTWPTAARFGARALRACTPRPRHPPPVSRDRSLHRLLDVHAVIRWSLET